MVLSQIKLSAPAHRALFGAGITQLEQLANYTEKEIASLHGMGPKAVALLKQVMVDNNITFASLGRLD